MYSFFKTFFLVVICIKTTTAQNFQYSQYYNAPLHLNPAFAGTSDASRVVLNARSQWTGQPSMLLNASASYDINLPNINSGVGAVISNDFWGSTDLRNTSLDLMYAYGLPINQDGTMAIRFALKAGAGNLAYNFGKATFGDQYSNRGLIDGRGTAENLGGASAYYTQFGGGALLYSQQFWLGVSADRLFATDIVSPVAGQFNFDRLPMQLGAHTGYRFYLDEDDDGLMISPTANFKLQSNFMQTDLGVYAGYRGFTTGLWYRGIPIANFNQKGVLNHDAIVVQGGYVWENIGFAYSFDATISALTLATAGSHEISVRYLFGESETDGRGGLPCPKF
jgi:type IX secretion system PorP/SprF family membrane protein